MNNPNVIRIGAAAEPGTRAYLTETLRTLADLAEAGEVEAVAIAYLGKGGRRGYGVVGVDEGAEWNSLSLLGALDLLHHQMVAAEEAGLGFVDDDEDAG